MLGRGDMEGNSMNDIRVRQATPADAEKMAELLIALSILPWIQSEPRDSVLAILAGKLRGSAETTAILVAEAPEGGLLGYGSVTWIPNLLLPGNEGYVSQLFIRADWRGHGIGTLILEGMEALARSKGCSRLSLLNLQDRESYRRAFYPKRGWEERTAAKNMIKVLPREG
jgi:GNAT superfamily N-acetyltransferase